MKGLDTKQQLLREKLNLLVRLADLPRVFADTPWSSQAQWEHAMSNNSLGVPLGLESEDDNSDTDERLARSGTISNILNGRRKITNRQLEALGRYTRLDVFLGGAEIAAWCLTDEVTLAEFQRRLIESRWARAEHTERALYGSRQLMLEAFAEFGLQRKGIHVGVDMVVTAKSVGPTRGARFPQWGENSSELSEFCVGSPLKIRLDVARASAVVLLELRPAPHASHGYEVSCLAPSALAPEGVSQAKPLILPTRVVHGVDSFVVDLPTGRHDWLAILCSEPIPVPWETPSASFHQPSAGQLDKLMASLKLARSNGATVEVRHFPFLITNQPRS
jgi:hypothetical protein